METLLKQSYCDAISEDRNKAFGQYELRTRYADRIFRAQIWVISSFSLLILMAILLRPEIKADEAKDIPVPVILSNVVIDLTIPEKTGKKTDEPEVKPPAETKVEPLDLTKSKLLNPELVNVDNDLKIDTSLKTSSQQILDPYKTTSGNGHTTGDLKLNGTGLGGENNTSKTGNGESSGLEPESEPLDFVEIEPAFPGDLQSFITKSTRYPGKAIDEGVEGQVFVCFIVDEKGKVTKPEVLKGIGYGCDEEAIRVMKSLPVFTPGKMNGHPVKVRMRMPFSFKLKK